MSVSHAIRFVIDVPYTLENVSKILKSGIDNELVYFLYDCKKGIDPDKILSADEGARYLLSHQENDCCGAWLMAKINETWFHMRVYESPEKLIVLSFANFSPMWINEFDNGICAGIVEIDFARYIRYMLKICQDYRVIRANTSST